MDHLALASPQQPIIPAGKSSLLLHEHSQPPILPTGKSTLLDIIAGRRKGGTVRGEVSAVFSDQSTVDLRQPEAVNHPVLGFGQLASYVQQDDCLVSNLTVLETLEFALRLRKPIVGAKSVALRQLKFPLDLP